MNSSKLPLAALVTAALIGFSQAQVHGQATNMPHQRESATGSQHMQMGEGAMMRQRMMGRMGDGMMGRNCPMMGMMMNAGQGGAHAAGRIAFIKAELGITEGQQEAFDAYANALKTHLEDMQGMRSKMMTAMNADSPIERMGGHIEMMESRLATLRAVKPPLERLYGELSDEQKKKADNILGAMGCMM